MGVSKVEFGDETLIDLTNDTVNENNLLEGATAHGANGEEVVGSVVVTDDYEELNNHPLVNGVELIGDKTSDDLKITWHGTKAEYDAITDKDENTLYIIEDEELIATTEQLGLVKPDGTTITIDEDGTISADSKTRILELNSPLSEIGILNTLKDNEGYECSGFFYNTDKNVYCEFEGLYSGYNISGETVHFGYCHIRGIHNSEYSVDYYIDDEDGSTWYKKLPADYLRTEFTNINNKLDSKMSEASPFFSDAIRCNDLTVEQKHIVTTDHNATLYLGNGVLDDVFITSKNGSLSLNSLNTKLDILKLQNFYTPSGEATNVPQSTWTKTEAKVRVAKKGYYIITMNFFRNQGGSGTVITDGWALTQNNSYSGDPICGGLSTVWGAISCGTAILYLDENVDYYFWVLHNSPTTHTIDIRASLILAEYSNYIN